MRVNICLLYRITHCFSQLFSPILEKGKEAEVVSKKAWIIFGIICVVVLGVLVYFSGKNKVDIGNVNTNTILGATAQSGNIADHVFGKKDSKVILTEYGDFQCPGCGGAHPTVRKLTEKYEGQIAFVFRNFPIASKHPNARAAAAAVEAAGLQGKYWQMHNMVFESQSSWENLGSDKRTDFFVDYAKQLHLDESKFKTDMESPDVSKKINYDQALGKKASVEATPTFFLNGKKLDENTWGQEDTFEKALTDQMKAQGISLPQ